MDWPCNLVGAENRRGRHQRWPVLVGWQKIVIPLKKNREVREDWWLSEERWVWILKCWILLLMRYPSGSSQVEAEGSG